MSVIFSGTEVSYNISGLGGLAIFKCLTHFPGTCPRFFIDGHNSQFHCIKGKWHDRRHFICSSFWSKIFCIRSLDTKKANIHTFLIDVIVIFSRVLGPIHGFRFRNKPCQFPFMSVIFSTARVSYNISGLFVIFKCLTHFPGTCPRFFIDAHNVQKDSSF